MKKVKAKKREKIYESLRLKAYAEGYSLDYLYRSANQFLIDFGRHGAKVKIYRDLETKGQGVLLMVDGLLPSGFMMIKHAQNKQPQILKDNQLARALLA